MTPLFVSVYTRSVFEPEHKLCTSAVINMEVWWSASHKQSVSFMHEHKQLPLKVKHPGKPTLSAINPSTSEKCALDHRHDTFKDFAGDVK